MMSACVQIGGHWLSWWMVAAAAVSQIGQFEAEMSSDSFQLLGMAERGFLPRALGQRSKHDTPTVSVCLCMLQTALVLQCNATGVISQHIGPFQQACRAGRVSSQTVLVCGLPLPVHSAGGQVASPLSIARELLHLLPC